jgi:predicted phage terminase large subunit-like protein
LEKDNFDLAHQKSRTLRKMSGIYAKEQGSTRMMELNRRSLLFDAPYSFDCYLRYVELDRKPRFYAPRRHYLKRYVDAYQDMLDGKLDFLSISMPKRAGKSQLGINFVNMLSGKRPDRSTLMEGTGDDLVKSFYNGCLEYLSTPNEYNYYDIFPDVKLVQTNADNKTINLNGRSRFPTIMCRSIDARQVGLSEATNILYLDDCVEGYTESKNRERLEEKWRVISGDIIGRAIEGTPIVICGTRYSIYDPIQKLQDEMKRQGKRTRIIETPALDFVTDESNFEYLLDGKPVFTTKYFRDQRGMLSPEQFESEFQQRPFEAKGLLFPENELNRYFELPVDRDPDAIIAVCDTAEGGGDSVMMPIAYVYGEDVFIEDCVFDDSTPEHTKPQCAKKLVDHKVSVATFESNAAGTYYARDVEELVKSLGGRCSIRAKRTISNKQTRIETASDGILKHFYFKDKSLYKPSSQYGMMIRELTTYTRTGRVPHDDAPDGLSLLENEIRNLAGNKVTIFQRPF